MKIKLDPGAFMPEYVHEQDAGADLRKNGFAENAGIWAAENWLAKIREDNENENVQGV